MRNINQYLTEKFKLNSKSVSKTNDIGSIDTYEFDGKTYNVVCVLNDGDEPIYMIDDKSHQAYWITSDDDYNSHYVDVKTKEDDGEFNTNKIAAKYKHVRLIGNYSNKECAAYCVKELYGDKAYIPSNKEFEEMYKNFKKINDNLENKLHGNYWTSTQYAINRGYYFFVGSKEGNYKGGGYYRDTEKNSSFKIIAFIKLK